MTGSASKKTVLCYGDSLTWGSIPGDTGRYGADTRWPQVMAKSLDHKVDVVEDGLRGRTTAYDEHLADCDRNGARTLPTALYNHAPLDLVIFMLGSNDMKRHIAGSAVAARQGMARLVSIVQNHNAGGGLPNPSVLIVSPPPLCQTMDVFFAEMFAGGIEQSAKIASDYREVAEEYGAVFVNAAEFCKTSQVDGVHLDAENTVALGKGIAPTVKKMLAL